MNRHDRRAKAAADRKAKPAAPRVISTSWKIFWLAYAALIAFWFLIALASPSQAHDWYDPACCGGNDCAPIPRESVALTREGWVVTLQPGQHPMVTRGRVTAIVPADEARPSQDADFHACVRDQSSPSAVMAEPIICLYIPMGAEGA